MMSDFKTCSKPTQYSLGTFFKYFKFGVSKEKQGVKTIHTVKYKGEILCTYDMMKMTIMTQGLEVNVYYKDLEEIVVINDKREYKYLFFGKDKFKLVLEVEK